MLEWVAIDQWYCNNCQTNINDTVKEMEMHECKYPFGKKNDRPNYYYTQDVYSDGQGITGQIKKRKNKNVRIHKIKKTT